MHYNVGVITGRGNMTRFLAFIFMLICFLTLISAFAQEDSEDMVLARVNNRLVSRRDVEKLLGISGDIEQLERHFHGPALEEKKKILFEQALGALILDAVIGVNAEWDDIELDETDTKRVEEQVRRFAGQYGSEANCELALNRRGCSLKDAKERIAKSLLAEKYVKAKLEVADFIAPSKVREYFLADTELREKCTEKRMIVIRQIVIKYGTRMRSKSEARKLVDQIKESARSGEDFGSLARRYSEGPKREEGGLWEPIALSDFRENIAVAIEGLEAGEVSEPVDRQNDFTLVKVEAEADPFETALKAVTQSLVNARKQEKLEKVMSEMYSRAEVELLLDGVKLNDICPGYCAEEPKGDKDEVEETSP
jgi:hypothetical protein